MIKLWLSNKIRFLSHLGTFIAGLTSLIAPWYVFLAAIVLALILDYVSFYFEYSE